MRKVSVTLTCQSKKHNELYVPQSIRNISDLCAIESWSKLISDSDHSVSTPAHSLP